MNYILRTMSSTQVNTPFAHRHRVRLSECDPQGRVFNSRYLEMFDVAIVELWREALGSYLALEEAGFAFVLAEIRVRYRAPAALDELLDVVVRPGAPGRSSLAVRFDVRCADRTVALADARYVCVDAAAFAPTPWPGWVRAGLAPYVTDNPTNQETEGR